MSFAEGMKVFSSDDLLWLGFLIAGGLELRRAFRPGYDALTRGATVGTGAIAFSFLFYDGLYWVTPCFLFFLLAGLALGAVRAGRTGASGSTGEGA